MLNSEDYETWAPDDAPWSPWVKPVLFAQLAETPPAAEGLMPWVPTQDEAAPPSVAAARPTHETAGLPACVPSHALVVDLPGAEAVDFGLQMARRGFRPVPLFNGTAGPSPVVPTEALLHGLREGTRVLRELRLPWQAPPAFLLDAQRLRATPMPGQYDNRWVVLPQDMPSGNALLAAGVREVTLVCRGTHHAAEDLAHVLLRWQEAGLMLRCVDVASGEVDEHMHMLRPPRFRAAWLAAAALLGLRRNNIGGFGAPVPEQVARTGFYG